MTTYNKNILEPTYLYRFGLDELPKEILNQIIREYYNYLRIDNEKNQKSHIYNLIYINRTICNTLVNSYEFWAIIIGLYSDDNILHHTYKRLDTNIYNSAYYCTSQCKIRDYLMKSIVKNKGTRPIVEIDNNNLMVKRTSVCSIPFESSFLVGGLGVNQYPFLRGFSYKGTEQINYLQANMVPEYKGKAIDSISCRNKLLVFSVQGSDIISVYKTNDVTEEKTGYLVQETFKSISVTGDRNKVKLSPTDANKLAIGGSDGGTHIYDLDNLIANDGASDNVDVPSNWGHVNYQLPIWDICFSNCGDLIFEAGESNLNGGAYYKNTGFVRCWDTRTAPNKMCWQLKEFIEIGGISQSQDSKCIAYVGRSGLVRVMDLRQLSQPIILLQPENSLRYDISYATQFFKDSVVWLPGGSNYLASSNYNEINLWSVYGDTPNILNLKIHKGSREKATPNQIDITDDGLLLCTYDTIYSINDISDISIKDYIDNNNKTTTTI